MNSKTSLTEIAVGLSGNEWDTETIYAVRALLARLHEHEMDIDPEWFGYLGLIRNVINALKKNTEANDANRTTELQCGNTELQ